MPSKLIGRIGPKAARDPKPGPGMITAAKGVKRRIRGQAKGYSKGGTRGESNESSSGCDHTKAHAPGEGHH